MKRLALLILMVFACSRTPLGSHASDGGSAGVAGAGDGVAGTPDSGGSVGGTQATGGVSGTGGLISASGGAMSTPDLDSCGSDADCVSSCIWVTAPTSSSQCTAYYCCGMTELSKRRCDVNQAAWATYCPNQSPSSQRCPCVAPCENYVFGCFGGRCMEGCPATADAAPDGARVANDDGPYRSEGDGDNTQPRFDGLYQSPVSDYFAYLRFYDDKKVISVSTSGTPEQIASWFNENHANVSIGTWSLAGQTIAFATTSSYGTVEYQGEIGQDQLILQVHSLINGHQASQVYSFVPMTFP